MERQLTRIAGDKWWIQCVPPDVRKNAEERKKKNKKPWPWMGERNYPLICYIDFTDYKKIILKKDNWRNAFKNIFEDELILSAKLKELEPIRVDIAHSRKLTKQQFEILRINTRYIIDCIKKSET